MPTLPLPSPTTARAAKLKRRPPLTTLAQRLMKTTFSISCGPSEGAAACASRRESRRGPRKERGALPLFSVLMGSLELQTGFTNGIGEDLHLAMIETAVAVEYDLVDAGRLGLGTERGAEGLRTCEVGLEVLLAQLGIEAGQENEGLGSVVVDQLSIDMLRGELDGEAGTHGGAGDLLADAPLALLQQLGFVNGIHVGSRA